MSESVDSSKMISDSSKKISELPRLSSVNDDAVFVFERANGAAKQSYKISYKDFFSSLSAKVHERLGFGSMIYEESDAYAKFAHGHPYSDFYWYPSYGPSSNNKYELSGVLFDYTNPASCDCYGTFTVVTYGPGQNVSSVNEISVCAPKKMIAQIDQTLGYEPHSIGDLQPLAMTKCTFGHYLSSYRGYAIKTYANGNVNIDIYNESFDGWVVPNGTTFACGANDFKDACTVYSSSKSPTATSFTVPNLDTFISCNPGVQTTNAIEHRNGQCGLSSHCHSLRTEYDNSKKIKINVGSFKLYVSGTSDKQMLSFVHAGQTGSKSSKPSEISVDIIDVDATIGDATVKENIVDDTEEYPAHNTLPMLMYIGRK